MKRTMIPIYPKSNRKDKEVVDGYYIVAMPSYAYLLDNLNGVPRPTASPLICQTRAMGIRIHPLNLSESDYAGEWFNFTQVKGDHAK